MPYIELRERARLERAGLRALCRHIEESNGIQGAGQIAYSVTRLMQAFVGRNRRFFMMALAGGAVLFALLEFYRRVVGPYEDQKILENGDVYPCENEEKAAVPVHH